MSEIANAYIALTVKMPGVKRDIERELGDVAPSAGKTFSAGLAGAVGGAVASVTTKVVDTVMGSINSAVSRVDMMNNFPKVMQNLGYSADDASASIQKMSDRLTGLPTALDGMAGIVQQLAPLTGGLDEATELSLALNNALLAGGKDTTTQANAMEQYTQMLSVGKVDMAAWRSMVTAMPGQMNQLSEALIGTGSSAMDLYEYIKAGEVTFDDFNAAILKLNSDGTGAYASFEEQARSSTEGIATGAANLQTAVTRGLANIIDRLKPMIEAFVAGATAIFSEGFKALGAFIDWVQSNKDWLAPLAVSLAVVAGGFAAMNAAAAIASAGGIMKFIAATKIGTAVQTVFNAVMSANPIMLVVTAIAALVAGLVWFFTQTELGQAIWEEFTRFLGEAWANISQFFIDAWENVIQPVFQAIGEIATWLWENILEPVFNAIGEVVMFVAGMFKLQFDLIVNAFRLVGAIAVWLWENVLKGVFEAIGNIVTWLWENAIKPVVDFIVAYFQMWGAVIAWLWEHAVRPAVEAIGAVFTWLYENIIKPVWDGISSVIGAAWDWIDKHVFQPFGVAIDAIGKAFEATAKVIGIVWDGIKAAVAEPINFVLGTIWNDGLRSFWNDLVTELGLTDMVLPAAPLIGGGGSSRGVSSGGPMRAFARGGVMPGYTPGRDVHDFYSPTAGTLRLSGGEAVMRPEFTRAVGGAAGVDALNRAARNGSLMGDGWGFFGDAWDWLQNAASVAWEFISNPIGSIRKYVVDGIIRPMSEGQNLFGRTAAGMAINVVEGMADFFEAAAPDAVGGEGMGWEAMRDAVLASIPGARITSGYRPGARTVNGGQSYHALGRAIDIVPATMDIFNKVASMFPNARELIFSPAGNRQLLNGSPFNGWSSAVRAQHWDHVHLAMAQGGVIPKLYDQGGWLPHGGVAVNMSGRPEAVLSPEESKAFKAGGKTVNVTFVNPQSVDPLTDAFEAAQVVAAW